MLRKHPFKTLATIAAFTVFSAVTASVSATLLDDAVWFEREVGDGLVWRYYHFDNLFGGKQSVSYIEVDLNNPSVDLAINYRDSYVGPSPGVSHPDFPRARTSILAPEIPGAKAAVNGTYFNTQTYDPANPSTPWGGGVTYLKVDGTVIHTFDGSSVNHHMQGILFNDKTDFEISRKTTGWANVQSNWQNMMISGPVLLENGIVEEYASNNNHANARHPRTAIGHIEASNTLILLTVDGRTNQALGMSCTELAEVLLALGCDNAINLDGGGSTTLWAASEPNNGILNYPSDNGAFDRGGERGAANVFVVISDDATPADWDGRINSLVHNDIVRTGETLEVTVEYENIGTETWTSSNVSVVPSRAFGRTSDFIPAGEESTFFTMTPSSVAPGQTATITLNLDPPTVANDTLYEEFFALWHETEGYFGPADNELRVNVLVRPELVGAPPTQIIHADVDNPFYNEGTVFGDSVVSFPLMGRSSTERFSWTSSQNRWAEFTPDFPVAGTYKVEIGFPFSSNSITTVQYVVTHANGTDTFTINQKDNGLANTWVELGEFEFNASSSKSDQSIRVTNGPTGSSTGNDRFYSGAARIDFVDFASTVEDWSLFD